MNWWSAPGVWARACKGLMAMTLVCSASCQNDSADPSVSSEGSSSGSASTSSTATSATSGTSGTSSTTEPTSSATATEPPEPGTFVALTYNVAGLPQGISGSEPELYMPQISPLLNAYDLVLVQEDFWYHADLTSQITHPYRSVPWPEELRSAIGDGLNRFSQFAFEPVERVPWYSCHGQLDCASDCLATKGWSFARTTLAEGVELDVYNLHMEAGGCDEDIAIREQAAMDLVAAIGERSADRAILVGGDFNLRYADEEDIAPLNTIVEGAQLTDVCDALACGAHDIDHFMFRSSAALRIEPLRWFLPEEFVDTESGDPLSDHPAVAVELRYVPL